MVNTWSNHSLINGQINGQHYFDGKEGNSWQTKNKRFFKGKSCEGKRQSPGHELMEWIQKYDSKKRGGKHRNPRKAVLLKWRGTTIHLPYCPLKN